MIWEIAYLEIPALAFVFGEIVAEVSTGDVFLKHRF